MTDLYDDMRAKPVHPDMDLLWRELGVDGEVGTIRLNDAAPLASTRLALTQRRPTGLTSGVVLKIYFGTAQRGLCHAE